MIAFEDKIHCPCRASSVLHSLGMHPHSLYNKYKKTLLKIFILWIIAFVLSILLPMKNSPSIKATFVMQTFVSSIRLAC